MLKTIEDPEEVTGFWDDAIDLFEDLVHRAHVDCHNLIHIVVDRQDGKFQTWGRQRAVLLCSGCKSLCLGPRGGPELPESGLLGQCGWRDGIDSHVGKANSA